MKLISKTSEIVLEIVFFYKTLSFPKAYGNYSAALTSKAIDA